jgi:hypothetical protein
MGTAHGGKRVLLPNSDWLPLSAETLSELFPGSCTPRRCPQPYERRCPHPSERRWAQPFERRWPQPCELCLAQPRPGSPQPVRHPQPAPFEGALLLPLWKPPLFQGKQQHTCMILAAISATGSIKCFVSPLYLPAPAAFSRCMHFTLVPVFPWFPPPFSPYQHPPQFTRFQLSSSSFSILLLPASSGI